MTLSLEAYSQDDGILKTEKIHYFYDYEITVTQYKRTSYPMTSPYICRAAIKITKKRRQIKKFEWYDIDAVGWHYGVFLPKSQESKDHFLLFKYGDYNSRTIILTKHGQVFDFGGGDYKIVDNKYLITNHHQDAITGLTVFDLEENEPILTTDSDKYFAYLYLSKGKIFIKLERYRKADLATKNRFSFYELDTDNKKLINASDKKEIFTDDNFVKVDLSNINLKADCECN